MQFVAQKHVWKRKEEEKKKEEKWTVCVVSFSWWSIDFNWNPTLVDQLPMAKVLHLSKLSRGHVEVSENGSRLDIIADHGVGIFIPWAILFTGVSLLQPRKDHLFEIQEVIN